MTGTTILHYEITEKLGEGGMGVVYKAHDANLDRDVALKFLPPHVSASGEEKARFIQEAKAASAMNHPNVCTIHDIKEHEDRLFIVMEYVQGQTLRQKIDSRLLNQKTAIEIGVQIADGLAAAHEKGIVHRDIKPENIMVRKDGIAQIMDFGLAKLRGVTRLTREGSTVGTAGYMSPEQVQGQEADHRSDIFSLGVLLYEMFAGELPFKGVHETALMYEIVNVDAVPMSSVKPDIEASLDAIILECLAKEPDERYQSAKEISKELKRVKRESGRQRASQISAVRPLPPKLVQEVHGGAGSTRSVAPWIAAALAALLGVLLGIAVVLLLTEEEDPAQIIQFQVHPSENVTIGQIAISPDGEHLVYVGASQGRQRLWLRPLKSVTSRPISGTEGAEAPFWSWDGRQIGFFAGGKLKRVDLAGSTPISICDAPNGRGGSWNEEGLIIFAPNQGGTLFLVPGNGGTPRQITHLDTLHSEVEHIWPFFLPDGKHFVALNREVRDAEGDIFLGSIDDGKRTPVLKSVANAMYIPSGFLLFIKEQALVAQRFDADKGVVTGDPFRVVENVGHIPLYGVGSFSVSRNGILVTGGGRSVDRTLAWFDRSGHELGLQGSPGNYFDIALSPDEKRAAVQLWDLLGGNSDIWVLEVERGLTTRFTFETSVEDDPVWSPDGKWLAFSSSRGEFPSPYRKLASGTGAVEALPTSGVSEFPSDWSPDGRFLAVTRQDPVTKFDIWVAPLTGGGAPFPLVQTEFDEWLAKFSPDGKWLAYASNESGRFEVYVRSFSGTADQSAAGERSGKWQVSSNGGAQPRWRKDGKELFYVDAARILTAVPVYGEDAIRFGA
ncbi:MAG: protein kinase, partial [Ignavibacteria bacterium]|nr:protein kinase [Ignavibacteria bacterium]